MKQHASQNPNVELDLQRVKEADNGLTRQRRRAASRHPETARKPRLRHAALEVRRALMPSGAALGLAAALLAQSPVAFALPGGAQVVAGSATVSQPNAQTLQIDQSTQKAILNWTSFSIGASEWVKFLQPNASAIALNRVVGNSPSEIFGRLTANGQIFLVNPSGVLFGRGASVDVGGIAASTLGITDANFLAGNYVFSNGGNAGSVVNLGNISSPSGYAALIGPSVKNDGLIAARLGSVALAAGDRVALDMIGDGLITVRVDQAALNASVINTGTIQADGGTVILTARSANALLDTVINSEGVVRARSIVERGGSIFLDGGNAGVVSVSGTLDASGAVAGTSGGSVSVLGQYVGLFGGANINASGDVGGGTVLVGGNFHGAGPEQNAFRTYVDKGAAINADAVTTGNGGKVVVWSDDSTRYFGSISARGGAQSGDGGSVEVSGSRQLTFNGTADLMAPQGKVGNLLLDPLNIEVITGGAQANLVGAPSDGNTNIYAFTEDPAASITGAAGIDPGVITTLLNSTSVTLQAKNDVTITNAINASGNAGNGFGLTLQAGNSITVAATGAITTRGGTLNFIANDVGGTQSGTGSIIINAPLNTTAGAQTGGGVNLTLSGGTGNVQLGANITTTNGAIIISGPIAVTANTSLQSGTGIQSMDVVVLANGATLSSTTTGAGALTATSISGTGGGAASNLTLNNAGGASVGAIGTDIGTLTLTGTALTTTGSVTAANTSVSGTSSISSAANNQSLGVVVLADGATLSSTTTGAGALTATSISGTGGGTQSNLTLNNASGASTGAIGTDIGTLTLTGTALTATGTVTASNTAVSGTSSISSGVNAQSLGAVALANGTTLTLTTTGAGTIGTSTITGVTGGATSNITFNSGGAVTISGAVGTDIGTVTITNSGGTTFQSSVNATTATLTNTTGTIDFQGNTTLGTLNTAAQGYNVSLTGASNTITNAVTFSNTGTVSIGQAGGTTAFTGGATATAPSSKSIAGTISAAGTGVINLGTTDVNVTDDATVGGTSTGQITLGNAVLTDAKTLTVGAGAATPISLGTVNNTTTANSSSLTIDTTGAATVGVVGGTNALNVVTLTQSGGTTFSGAVNAATTTLTDTTGNITFNGALTTGTLNTAAQTYNVALNGGATVTNAATFSNTGTLTLGNAAADILLFNGGLTATAPAVTLNGTVRTSADAISLGSATKAVTLAGTTSILDTTNSGGSAAGNSITVAGAVDGTANNAQSLTLNGGTGGAISFTANGVVGGTVNKPATLTVTNSNGATFTGAVSTGTSVVISDTQAGQTVGFAGGLTTPTLTVTGTGNAYNVSLTGTSNTITNATTFSNTGTLTLGDASGDALAFTGGLTSTVPSTTTINGAVSTTNTAVSLAKVTTGAGASVSSGTGAITLSGATGALDLGTGTFTTTNTSATAINIISATSVALANLSAAAAGGTVNIGSVGNVTGAVTQNTGTTITANTLTANTGLASGITLDKSNNVTNLGAITAPGGFTLTNGNNGTTITGSISTTDNLININVGTGTYTQNDFDLSSGSGAITVTANGVALAANTLHNAFQTTGVLTLQPGAIGTTMSLGTGGVFSLTAAEVTDLSGGVTGAGSIVIGRSDHTSTLTTQTAVNFGAKSVTLRAGSFVGGGAGDQGITATTLDLDARTGGIGTSAANGSIDTTVTNLNLSLAGGAGTDSININQTGNVTLGNNRPITTGAANQSINIVSSGVITVDNAMTVTGTGNISLTAGASQTVTDGVDTFTNVGIIVTTNHLTGGNQDITLNTGTLAISISGSGRRMFLTDDATPARSRIVTNGTVTVANDSIVVGTNDATNAPQQVGGTTSFVLGPTDTAAIGDDAISQFTALTGLVAPDVSITDLQLNAGNVSITGATTGVVILDMNGLYTPATFAIVTGSTINGAGLGASLAQQTSSALTMTSGGAIGGVGAVGALNTNPLVLSMNSVTIPTTGGANGITITDQNTGTTTFNIGGTLAVGAVNIARASAGNMALAGISSSGTTISHSGGGDIIVSGGVNTGNTGSTSMTTTGGGNITLNAGVGNTTGDTVLTSSGNITRTAGTVSGNNVTLNATGTVGTSSAARVSTTAGTLAANGSSVFVSEANAVTLDTINAVTNSATTTYDLTAGGTITVTGSNIGNGTNTFVNASVGNIAGAGSVAGTNVALSAAGTVGTSAGSRLSTAAGTLAANGSSVFVSEADAVTLNTVNAVTNSAATTYDLTAGNTITVAGANVGGGTNAFLNAAAGNIAGAGSVAGTNVALSAVGTVGTDALTRLATAAGTLGASGSGVFIAETNAVTLDTVNSVANSATTAYDLTAGGNIVGGAGAITAANLTLNATGGIGIGTAVNTNTASALSLTTAGAGAAGNITVVEANALPSSRVTLNTAGTAQTVSLTSTAGPITLDAAIGNATDNLTLIATAGNIVGGAGTATANNLTLNAAGGIGVGTPVNTNTAGTLSLTTAGAGAAGDITLVEANTLNLNTITTAVATTQTVTLTSGTGITISGAVGNTGATRDNFSLTATTGNISGGGGTLAGNNITLDAVAGGIGVGTQLNTNTQGNLSLTTGGVGAAGNITLSEANALNTNQITALATDVSAQTVSLAAPSIVLGAAIGNATDNITLIAGTTNITGASTVTGATVTLDSVTGVGTGTGARVSTAADTLAARSTTSGGVFVSEANAVTLAGTNSAASTAAYDLTSGGTITVSGAVNTANTGNTNLATTAGDIALGASVGNTTGNTSLVSAGNISQSAGTLSAATLTGSAAGSVTLTQANTLTNLGDLSSGGGITLVDVGGLVVNGTVSGSVSTQITTSNGLLNVTGSVAGGATYLISTGGTGDITIAGPVTGTVSDVGIDAGRNVTVGATVTSGGGQPILVSFGTSAASGTFAANAGAVFAAGSTTTVTGGAGADNFNIGTSITANLVGGAGVDVFALGANTVTGSIDGGANGGQITGLASPTLTAISTLATTGFMGTAAQVTGGFDNITDLAGTGTLTGAIAGGNFNFSTNVYSSGANSLHYAGYAVDGGGFATSTGDGGTYNSFTATKGTFTANGTPVVGVANINDTGAATVTMTGAGATGGVAGDVTTVGGTVTLDAGPNIGGSLNMNGAGTLNMGTAGTVAGTVSTATVNYASYATPVTFDLANTSGATTGVGTTWSGITTVTGSGNSDTMRGGGAVTFAMNPVTANAGSSGGITWTSFENLQSSGAGIFTTGANGSVSGSITAVGGTLDYTGHTTAVTFDLANASGATTGVGTTWSGITAVTGSANSDTIHGNGGTYNLTGANAGNNGTTFWTSFENLTDAGAATVNGGGSIAGALTNTGGSVTLNGTIGVGSASLGATTVGPAAIINAGAGDVVFNSTVNGANDLTVNSTGTTAFLGMVGGSANLASLTTNAGGTTVIAGGGVTTTGAQNYGDPVTLGATTVLTGATLALGGTVTGGNNDLTLNFTGPTAVSNATLTGIKNLATGSTGTTTLGSMTTTGTQTYSNPVATAGAITLTSSGAGAAGNITAANPLNNFTAGALTLTSATGSAQIANAGALQLGASSVGALAVTSTGAITQTGALTVPGTSSFNAGANAITLTQANNFTGLVTLNNTGANVVSVTNAGALAVGGSVGSDLVTTSPSLSYGSTVVGGNLLPTVTTGGITQSGPVTVNGTTTLTTNSASQIADLSTQPNNFVGAVSTGLGGVPWMQVLLNSNPNLVIGNISVGSALYANNQISAITTGTLSAVAPGAPTTGILTVTGPSTPVGQPAQPNGTMTLGSGNPVTGITVNPPPASTLSLLALLGSSNSWQLLGQVPVNTQAANSLANITINGVTVQAGALGSALLATIGSAQASALSAAAGESKKSFGTDSVAQQIDYGFAGDIGVAPTMAHEIPLEGETIFVPPCTTESKNNLPCKK